MTVEEAELAIARAGGGPAPAGTLASTANGSAAGLPSAVLVGAPKGIYSCLPTIFPHALFDFHATTFSAATVSCCRLRQRRIFFTGSTISLTCL